MALLLPPVPSALSHCILAAEPYCWQCGERQSQPSASPFAPGCMDSDLQRVRGTGHISEQI